jgi:hypothetical protein
VEARQHADQVAASQRAEQVRAKEEQAKIREREEQKQALSGQHQAQPAPQEIAAIAAPAAAPVSRAKPSPAASMDLATARQRIAGIYTKLESNAVSDAYNEFISIEPELERVVHHDVFMMCKYSVTDAYNALTHPDASGTIANETAPQPLLVEKAPERPVQVIDSTSRQLQSQETARNYITVIYKALEVNDIRLAFTTFQKNQDSLQKNLSSIVYDMLKQNVDQAYEEYRKAKK